MIAKKSLIILSLVWLASHTIHSSPLFGTRGGNYEADFQWAIIGAGPAGIIAAAVLRDLGTPDNAITLVDPEFNAGRMGAFYSNVPGNAKVKDVIDFLTCSKTFQEISCPAFDILYTMDPEFEYSLKYIVEPLIAITKHLCSKLECQKATLTSLSFENDVWRVGTTQKIFTASHVILATGSHPKRLDYECKQEIILDQALDKPYLATAVGKDDTVAVVGSGQSAILLLKYLTEVIVGRVINFYKKPIDFDNPESGLKGITAKWAQEVLLKKPPVNLLRLLNTPEALQAWLPICTKIIYAIGFERNEIPLIGDAAQINFDDRNGIIGPRLFGIGIAFPEKIEDEAGNLTARIGLLSFMEYAQEILPQWLAVKAPLTRYEQFEDLFRIEIL